MTAAPTFLDRVSELAWAIAETLVLVPRLIFAVIILVAGALVAQWVARAVIAAMAETGRIDETARPTLASAARYGVLIVTFVAALSQIGAQTASLLAAPLRCRSAWRSSPD